MSWFQGDASEVVRWLRPHRTALEWQVSREKCSENMLGLFCCINPSLFAILLSAQSKVGQIDYLNTNKLFE